MAKAQEGMNAAILVAIISGLLILYILFLPAENKRELLDGSVDGGTIPETKKGVTVLLSQSVNDILEPSTKVEDLLIPNVFLTETTNADILDKITPISVRNSWLDKKSKTVKFRIDEPQKTSEVILSFIVTKKIGTLIISLNNEVIYEFEPQKQNVVIELKESLLENDNTLDFSVSPIGYKFWSTNEYSLDDIKIVGNVLDRSRSQSKSIVEFTESEFANIEKATLKWVPYCRNVLNLGPLEVFVNDNLLFSGVPVCEDRMQIPILTALNEGQNEITFNSNGGRYSIEQIRITTELKEPKVLTSYFEVSPEHLKEIGNNEKEANLSITFVDDDKSKRADISLNGRLIRLDQSKPLFNERIATTENNKLREGNNYIEIRPKTSLKIIDVKIFLVNK